MPPQQMKKANGMAGETVPRLYYEEKEQECIAKDEQIQVSRLATAHQKLEGVVLIDSFFPVLDSQR